MSNINNTENPETCALCGDPIWLEEPFYHGDFDNKPVHHTCAMKQKFGEPYGGYIPKPDPIDWETCGGMDEEGYRAAVQKWGDQFK